MRRIFVTGLAGAFLLGTALAAEAPPAYSGSGDQPPGGLTAHQVIGKRLLDANGAPIGDIMKVAVDGQTATVRPLNGGPAIMVEMNELSLGTGLNTVVKSGNSDADRLNRRELGH